MTLPANVDPVPGHPDPSLPILVVHIPRTGGSTLKFMLQTTFGSERTLLDAHWFRTSTADLSQFAVVEGHLPAAFFARAFGAGWRANGTTLLRDPVARTVSQARHIRARPGPAQEHLQATVRDPAAVFERIPNLVNLQTKALSATPLDARTVSADALDEAKAALDEMAFGLTEAFDSSIALLMERLQIGIPKFDVANVSRGTHDDDLLSDEFRAAARDHNDVDRQLYDYAAGLLRSRITGFTQSLLALPTEESTLTCALRFRGQPVEHDVIRVPDDDVTARFSGWVLVNGRAADAALVRVGATVIPLVPRVERDDAARQTHDLHNRNAGVLGTVTIPRDARSLELIAFDRTENRRASHVVGIERVEPEPLVARVKTRLDKFRRK